MPTSAAGDRGGQQGDGFGGLSLAGGLFGQIAESMRDTRSSAVWAARSAASQYRCASGWFPASQAVQPQGCGQPLWSVHTQVCGPDLVEPCPACHTAVRALYELLGLPRQPAARSLI